MKKLFYILTAAAAVFALGSCKQPDEGEPVHQDTVIFEIDDLEALPAAAGTFTVGVNTNVPFTVEVPDDVDWLRYLETKAAAPEPPVKKTVEFEVDLNEADAMRQARVKFLDSAGEQLKALTIIQKAGGGIEFEVAQADEVPVSGAVITLAVSSNVPYEAKPEVDWITVKSVTATATELEIASNGTVEPRDGKVNFFREGTENLIGFVEIHQMEPNVIIKTVDGVYGYASVSEAMTRYNTQTEGEVELILAKGTHTGNIIIDSNKVPITITGNGVATLDGTIETCSDGLTVKDLVIAPSKGVKPTFSTGYNYEFGIFVHHCGTGTRLENVTLDMSGLATDATGIFLLSEGEAGTKTDIIKNCVIDGGNGGHRLIQAYGAKANITGSTFKNPYSSYAVRFGDSESQILLSSNTFEGTAACAVHFNNLTNSVITLGNGTKDTNKFAETFTTHYKANTDVTAGGNQFSPVVTYADGVLSIYVDPNAPATLERVWGYYNGSRGEWDDQITSCANWNRNGIISGNYVYVTIAGNEDGMYGVAVFDLFTGEYIRTITNGFTKEGRFWTSGIVKMAAYDDDVIYVCNMAMSSSESSQDLVIYRLIEPDSEGVPTAAEVAGRYTVPAGERYGDKMTCYGDNNDGLLLFVSFYDNKDAHQYRQEVEFRLTEGVIGSEPDAFSNALAGRGGSITGGIYILAAHGTGANATRQAIYGSNFEMRFVVGWWWGDLDQWYNCRIDENGGWEAENSSIFTGVGYFDNSCMDPKLFWVNGIRYLAYTVVNLDESGYSNGFLRVVRIPDADGSSAYPMLNILWAAKDNAAAFQRYPIGDPDDFEAVGHETTNKTAFCDAAYVGDDIYILSGVTSTGMSVFKVE